MTQVFSLRRTDEKPEPFQRNPYQERVIKSFWEALVALGWTRITGPDESSVAFDLPDTTLGVSMTRGGGTLTIRQVEDYNEVMKRPIARPEITATVTRVDRGILAPPTPEMQTFRYPTPPVDLPSATAYLDPGALVMLHDDGHLLLMAEWDEHGAHALMQTLTYSVSSDGASGAVNCYGVSVREGVTPEYARAVVSAFPLVESLVDAGARIFQPFTLYDRSTQEAVHTFSAALPVLARLPEPVTVQGVTYDRDGRRT